MTQNIQKEFLHPSVLLLNQDKNMTQDLLCSHLVIQEIQVLIWRIFSTTKIIFWEDWPLENQISTTNCQCWTQLKTLATKIFKEFMSARSTWDHIQWMRSNSLNDYIDLMLYSIIYSKTHSTTVILDYCPTRPESIWVRSQHKRNIPMIVLTQHSQNTYFINHYWR